jgi:hypothetical protein
MEAFQEALRESLGGHGVPEREGENGEEKREAGAEPGHGRTSPEEA